MIKNNSNKIFSISGFSYITKIHDGNFATINMNNTLKIYSGKKPFNCLNKGLNITKGTNIFNLKEIFLFDYNRENNIKNEEDKKIYLIIYEKDILIFSFENLYKKHSLLQKFRNEFYVEILIQLSTRNIIFFDKDKKVKLLEYKNESKIIFNNKIHTLQKVNKEKNYFILSFIEFENNHILTTSTSKHPSGKDVIGVYEIQFNSNHSKLINYQNFNGYSCAIFENNVCKLEKQKTLCIAINYYIKKNIILNNNAIVLLNYEFLEITTILEIEFQINTIFNFSFMAKDKNYNSKLFEYILICQIKGEATDIKKKKITKDNFRFIDFYVFKPQNEYEPLLIEEKRILTQNTIDITNAFLLNNNYLVIFQTTQISIYEIF